jgi:hypothetical protein
MRFLTLQSCCGLSSASFAAWSAFSLPGIIKKQKIQAKRKVISFPLSNELVMQKAEFSLMKIYVYA